MYMYTSVDVIVEKYSNHNIKPYQTYMHYNIMLIKDTYINI